MTNKLARLFDEKKEITKHNSRALIVGQICIDADVYF